MEWSAMPYFLAIAREGSLRAAALSLGATHATVDRHVKALEASYGVRLFDRTRGGMSLTPAGESLLPLAENAEDAMNGAKARVLGLDQEAYGTVKVSVPPVLGFDLLPRIFQAFSEAYPDIKLDITVTNRFEDLNRLEADVSIRVAYEVTDDVVGRKVAQTAIGLYCSPWYLEHKVPQSGPDGAGLDWVAWTDSDDVQRWASKTPYSKANARHVAREVVMQKEMIRAGMGFGYLPVSSVLGDHDFVQMPGTKVELNRWIWILMHGELRKTMRVRLFVDFMAQEIRAMRKLISGEAQNAL
ncbi:DNA-binding transcriptional LysR family regulator [Shimia isoporae]|uniref:DNA-binding transcriptional LysR family regulator n=1 Tax=Shimia isoporae TaxID=647720 RepID=A0A4R1NWL2_9RHOB|nr:LysR family transcriptional regulator [Shimia isoporae]TCL09532.1 DNA-binding transcriptional LysR family regulator [Shimia isoporae]